MAYPLVLSSARIDSQAWYAFMEAYNKSLEVSSEVKVVQLGAAVVSFVPSATASIIGSVAGLAAKHGGAAMAKATGDQFLENANETFFRPRGLVAAVITFTEVSNTGALPPTAELVYREDQPGTGSSSSSSATPIKGLLGQLESRMDKKAQTNFEKHVQMVAGASSSLSSGAGGGRVPVQGRSDLGGYGYSQQYEYQQRLPPPTHAPHYGRSPSPGSSGSQFLGPQTAYYDPSGSHLLAPPPAISSSRYPMEMGKKARKEWEKEERHERKTLRKEEKRYGKEMREGKRDNGRERERERDNKGGKDVRKAEKKLKEYLYFFVTEIPREGM